MYLANSIKEKGDLWNQLVKNIKLKMKGLRINLKIFILLFNFFFISFLVIEDRFIYVPLHTIEIPYKGWDKFIEFIKSFWRTGISVGYRALVFWLWTILKAGFIIFIFELSGIFDKEKVVLKGVIYSIFPILFLIFFKFLFLVFLKKDFNSSLSLIYVFNNKFLDFVFSSFELFKFLEFTFLYYWLKKINLSSLKLIIILAPLFFLEKYIEFAYFIK